MSGITITSTTDTPAEVQAAIEKAGLSAEQVSGEETTEEKTTPPESAAPPAEKTGQDGEGKSADASGATEESTQEPEENEGAEETEPGQTAQAEDKPVKGKGGFQKRIDKLTSEKKKLEAEAADLKRQLAAKSAAKPEEKPATPPAEEKKPAAEAKPKPKLEEFESYEDFVEALTDWKSEALRSEVATLKTELKAKEEADKQAAERQPLIDAWLDRVEEAKKRYPDYDEVTAGEEAEKLPVTEVMHQALFESEAGPDLVYYLGKNPEECRRIAALAPIAAVRELTKLEAKIAAAPAKPATPEKPKNLPSRAPAPLRPVGGSATPARKDPKDMTPAEYLAFCDTPEGQLWRKERRSAA